ncbi:MAG: peroxiredoxin-like family protein [Ferruginibacter sp.]
MKKIILIAMVLVQVVSATAQHEPKGLNVNDKAPEFSAVDQNGKPFELKKELNKGSVVLVFYRGQWCPYCNRQLKELEDSLSLMTAKGATLVAVTPEKSDNISKTIEKTKASYPILYDDGLKIMKSYDVAFSVDEKTIEKYKGYGIDFTKANGDNGANLPVPAVYIINKEGKVVYRYFDKNYSKRASVAEILQYL